MAKAVEILGDRWTLLIVRDLICGMHQLNALERGLPGIPKAILAERFKRLQQAGIVKRVEDSSKPKISYHLTPAGWELVPVLEQLTQWGAKWAFGEPDETELNPVLLLWWMHSRVHHDRLPQQRVVVEFDFHETRPKRYSLILKPKDVSICIQHPGFEIDVLVTAELAVFYQAWVERVSFSDVLREQRIQLDVLPAFTRDFPAWFALSPIAGVVHKTVALATAS